MFQRRSRATGTDELATITISLLLFLLGGFVVLLFGSYRRRTPVYAPQRLNSDQTPSFFGLLRRMTITEVVTAGLTLAVLGLTYGLAVVFSRYLGGTISLMNVRLSSLILALLSLLLLGAIWSQSTQYNTLTVVFTGIVVFCTILLCIVILFSPQALSGTIPNVLLLFTSIAALLTLIWLSGKPNELSVVAPGIITLGVTAAGIQLGWWLLTRMPSPPVAPIVAIAFLSAILLGIVLNDIRAPKQRESSIMLLLSIGVAATVISLWASLSTSRTLILQLALLIAFFAPLATLPLWRTRTSSYLTLPSSLFTGQRTSASRSVSIYSKQGDLLPDKAHNLIPILAEHGKRHDTHLIFSMVTCSGKWLTWRITDPAGSIPLAALADDVRTYAPGAVVTETEDVYEPKLPLFRQVIVFGLANDYAAPLPRIETIKTDTDPLTAIALRMGQLDPSDAERVSYQVFLITDTRTAQISATKRLADGQIQPLSGLWRERANDPIAGFDIGILNNKVREKCLYHCILAITIESANRERLVHLAQLASDVEQIMLPGYNHLVRRSTSGVLELTRLEEVMVPSAEILVEAWKRDENNAWRETLLVLSAGEIATLWHLPTTAFAAAPVVWGKSAVPSELTDPMNATCIGAIEQPCAPRQLVYLKTSDRRRHHYIAGMPGTGKSTLMHSLVQQDIEHGDGVIVIDPHGTLIKDILSTSIPPTRLKDVELLECGREDFPVPLNPFRLPDGETVDRAYNYVMFAMQRIYASIWLEGQTQSYIQRLVQLLLTDPEATPLDVRRVLEPKGTYLNQLLDGLSQNPRVSSSTAKELRQFWRTFQHYGEGKRMEIARPILSRTDLFLSTPQVRLMTCHPRSVNFRGLLEGRKIVLINLFGDTIFTEVDNLATLFLTGFFLAAFSLKEVSDELPPYAYAYVDELERMSGAPIPEMVEQMRKFGLAMVMSNQNLSQFAPDYLNRLLGSVGTRTLFELGQKDARQLESEFAPDVTAEDIRNLGKARVAVRTRADGRTVPAFIMNTIKPTAVASAVEVEVLRERAAQQLLSRPEVEEWLDKRYPDDPPEEQSRRGIPGSPKAPSNGHPPPSVEMPETE